MAFVQWDDAFQRALDDAWAYVLTQPWYDPRTDVRWSLKVWTTARHRSTHLLTVEGGSIGAGCALGLLHVLDPQRPPIAPGWAITGAVTPGGAITSVTGYDAKLAAARDERQNVIVPVADLPGVREKKWDTRFVAFRLALEGAATVEQASATAVTYPSSFLVQQPLPVPEPERPPVVVNFVGRAAELAYFANKLATVHLAVIVGMAGVGKTALAAVLAQQVSGRNEIFWHTFRKDQGFNVIIWKLAGFLAWHKQEDLWRRLESARRTGEQLPPPEVFFDYLIQMLRGQGYILCFDDFHFVDGDPLFDHFARRLRSEVVSGGLKLILVSRHVPVFMQAVPFEPLMGLTSIDTHELLKQLAPALPNDLAARLYSRTEGNGQLLLLSVDALQRSAKPADVIARLAETNDVERFLLTEVDAGLSEDERAVMRAVAALLGDPGARAAIEALMEIDRRSVRQCRSPTHVRVVQRILSGLCERHLLTMSEGEAGRQYGQHAMVQAFYYNHLTQSERRALHRRAGMYYETEEPDILKAGRHLQRAGEHTWAARLATSDIWALINRGQVHMLIQLLEQFDEGQIDWNSGWRSCSHVARSTPCCERVCRHGRATSRRSSTWMGCLPRPCCASVKPRPAVAWALCWNTSRRVKRWIGFNEDWTSWPALVRWKRRFCACARVLCSSLSEITSLRSTRWNTVCACCLKATARGGPERW